MSFAVLSVLCLVALLGPLLALDERWHVPVVVGELLAGLALGSTGLGWLQPADPVFAFLASIGFALMMFVAGTHVTLDGGRTAATLRTALRRVALVCVVAVVLGTAVAWSFDTGHAALYAVLLASSSAALVLPVVDSLSLRGRAVDETIAQVAVADTLCIVALPLAIDPGHAVRAALGAALVVLTGVAAWWVLLRLDRMGIRRRVHDLSERRRFALELRINLVILFALAAIAVRTHVSVMLAGFTFGLAVSAIGEPRRLARQLFALADGFFAPLFFVWLGAGLDVRALVGHPGMALLGVVLGGAAVLAHLAATALRQPVGGGLLAAAQLGVPVAAATIGSDLGVLEAGEAPALLLGALLTVGAASLGGALLARSAPPTSVGGPG